MVAMFGRMTCRWLHMRLRRVHSRDISVRAGFTIRLRRRDTGGRLRHGSVMHRTHVQSAGLSHQKAEPDAKDRGTDPLRE